GHAKPDAQFVRDDAGERGLAQPRRPVQEHMVEGFPPLLGRLDENRQTFFNLVLTDVCVQPFRPQARVDVRVLGPPPPAHDPLIPRAHQDPLSSWPSGAAPPAPTRPSRPAGRPAPAAPLAAPVAP